MQAKETKQQEATRTDISVAQLKQLDKNERVIIGLYFYELLSVDEIALIMQSNTKDIQGKLDQIFSKLKYPQSKNVQEQVTNSQPMEISN